MPFVEIEDKKYFYRRAGEVAGEFPVALFLHGSGGDGTVWRFQLEGLSDFCHVIVPDLPGHGQSEGSAGLGQREMDAWLESLVEALSLPSFFLIGHSLGGALAQGYAYAYPSKVEGLVLTGTGTDFCVADEYLELLQDDFEAAVKASCDSAFGTRAPEKLYRAGREMLLRNGPRVLYKDLIACSRFDSSRWASDIDKPVLVICGSDDKITPSLQSEALNRSLSVSDLLIVAEAGHMVMVEAPETFNGAAKGFILKHSGQ